jgi:hypothetical protein
MRASREGNIDICVFCVSQDEPLLCICQQPYDDTAMLGCEGCEVCLYYARTLSHQPRYPVCILTHRPRCSHRSGFTTPVWASPSPCHRFPRLTSSRTCPERRYKPSPRSMESKLVERSLLTWQHLLSVEQSNFSLRLNPWWRN